MARQAGKGLTGRRAALSAALVLALTAGGCAGSGAAVRHGVAPERGPWAADLALLPSGAAAYLAADVAAVRPILDRSALLAEKSAGAAVSRTATVAAALFSADGGAAGIAGPVAAGGGRFLLAASGRYPVFRAGISFSLSREWKRRRSSEGFSFWRSDRRGLSLSLSAGRALISDGIPLAAASAPVLPEGVLELSSGAAAVLWVDRPELIFAPILGAASSLVKLPAERIILSLHRDGADAYLGTLRLETPSASHARALSAMLSLLRPVLEDVGAVDGAGLPSPARALFSRPPAVVGRLVEFRDISLEAEDLALLLDRLSVYSHH